MCLDVRARVYIFTALFIIDDGYRRIVFKGLTEYFKLIETEPKRKGFVNPLPVPTTQVRSKRFTEQTLRKT